MSAERATTLADISKSWQSADAGAGNAARLAADEAAAAARDGAGLGDVGCSKGAEIARGRGIGEKRCTARDVDA